ncbi:unnamed protein product [Coffea canephora]|uniref:Uncharacterized protein n=1 Tax=Coffea canephora TaxID=49390 RepID=A0A068U1K3_COFCA|nr:unnamed protein product [Coffea canephora]
MGSSEEKVVAVIMSADPLKALDFGHFLLILPSLFSLWLASPWFTIIFSACKRIKNLAQIFLIGFYEEGEFALYVSSISSELRVSVIRRTLAVWFLLILDSMLPFSLFWLPNFPKYLKEDGPHGSAFIPLEISCVVYVFFGQSHIFWLNCDVCCNFPSVRRDAGYIFSSLFVLFYFLILIEALWHVY